MIYNVHSINTKNIGDLSCGPADYFDFDKIQKVDIKNSYKSICDKNDVSAVIVGGGGLLHGKWKRELFFMGHDNSKSYKLIAWGLGANTARVSRGRVLYGGLNQYLEGFDLIGTRDYGSGYDFVPCVSCMNPLFNIKTYPTVDIGIYNHYLYPIPNPYNFPEFNNNNTTFENVITFIRSHETILTSSYHGIYWSLLLGRKVVIYPGEESQRFYGFKYNVPIIKESADIMAKYAIKFDGVLEESKNLNKKFYNKVLNILQ